MILAIYGCGGLGHEVYDMASTSSDAPWGSIVFIDDTGASPYRDVEVLDYGTFKERYTPSQAKIAIALGEPSNRDELARKVADDGYSLATVIDASAHISPSARIDAGCIIKGGAQVTSDAVIEANTCLQENSLVAHDVVVETGCVVSAFAFIGGHGRIGAHTFIGPHACVRDRIRIGEKSVIGMGAVVTRDVPAGIVAFGVPAEVVDGSDSSHVFKG